MINKSLYMKRLRLFVYLYLLNPIFFLKQSLRHWMVVGAVLPTGGPLRRAVYNLGIGSMRNLDLVVIHGIGSGELLYELIKFILTGRVKVRKCVVMDMNQIFIDRSRKLYALLRECFNFQLDVIFITMDAFDTPKYLHNLGIDRADLIIGTLPYSNMPQDIGRWVAMYREYAKVFCYYTYAVWTKRPSARVATRKMMDELEHKFSSVSKSNLVWLNVPPGYAISARA